MNHTAHDNELIVDDRKFQVRRDMALARRLEQDFGPLRDIEYQLRDQKTALGRIAEIYAAMLHDQSEPVSLAAIELHIMRVGAIEASGPVIEILQAMFLGHARYAKLLADEDEIGVDMDADNDDLSDILADPPPVAA